MTPLYNDEDEFAPVDYDANAKLQARGALVGQVIMDAVEKAQLNAPRTLQSKARQLGMSELGGCREFIRATVQGDSRADQGLKWSAFVGTAVGDFVEAAVKEQVLGASTQETVIVNLEIEVGGRKQPITVTGHTDIVMGDVVDLKTRNGLEEVRRDGPKLKEVIQVSGYFIALLEAGRLVTPDGTAPVAILVYLDRSGATKETHTFTIDERMARMYLQVATQRLGEVAAAMAAGTTQSYLRDEPESWCHYVKCPFRAKCWKGYAPTNEIEHPDIINGALMYDEGRELAKKADGLKAAGKAILHPEDHAPIEGVMKLPDRDYDFELKWTAKAGRGGSITDVIDLRRIDRTVSLPIPGLRKALQEERDRDGGGSDLESQSEREENQ